RDRGRSPELPESLSLKRREGTDEASGAGSIPPAVGASGDAVDDVRQGARVAPGEGAGQRRGMQPQPRVAGGEVDEVPRAEVVGPQRAFAHRLGRPNDEEPRT